MLKKITLLCLLFLFSLPVISAEKPRWVTQPIHVYIPENGNYSKLMQRAFNTWDEKSDSLVRFKFVSRPTSADIDVRFLPYVPDCGRNLGEGDWTVGCARTSYYKGNIHHVTIDIGMYQIGKDKVYRPVNNIYGVMLHEIGHAIGLGHSENPDSIMYSYDLPTLQHLTKEDFRLLYKKYH